MKAKILSIMLLTTASNCLSGYATDGTPKASGRIGNLSNRIGNLSNKEVVEESLQGVENQESSLQGNDGAKKRGVRERLSERAKARALQEKGRKAKQTATDVASPLQSAGVIAGKAALAKGDPNSVAAAAAFNLAVVGAEGLGKAIGQIIISVGRSREQAEAILSATEVLVEDANKSAERIKYLEKQIQEILDVDTQRGARGSKSSEEDDSRLQQFGKKLSHVPTTVQKKAGQAIDLVTNAKEQRGQKLQAIQAALKEEGARHDEIIRLLQVKLLENTLNVILQQITRIEQDIHKNPSPQIMTNLRKEEATLGEEKKILIKKIDQLLSRTKLGALKYLQNTIGIPAEGPVDWPAIAALYREIRSIKDTLTTMQLAGSSKQPTEMEPLKKMALGEMSREDQEEPKKGADNLIGAAQQLSEGMQGINNALKEQLPSKRRSRHSTSQKSSD